MELFRDQPLMLTDELANSTYLSEGAELLLGDRAGALVNRLSFSLLGFGSRGVVPPAIQKALLGEGPAWRGAVDLAEAPPSRWHVAEISAIRREGRFLCGVVRLSREEGIRK